MDVNTRWAKEAALKDDQSLPKSIDVLSLIRGLAQVLQLVVHQNHHNFILIHCETFVLGRPAGRGQPCRAVCSHHPATSDAAAVEHPHATVERQHLRTAEDDGDGH